METDLVGYDDEGKLILIDVGVKTLGALSYRGLRKTMRSTFLITFDIGIWIPKNMNSDL